MDKSTATATAAVHPPETDQLALRLFATVGAYRSAPPDRALWRELLNLALGEHQTLRAPDGRPVATSTLWSVAATLWLRASSAGVVSGFPVRVLAGDCRLDRRTVRAALATLEELRVLRRVRYGRRAAAGYWLNVGGLDWPAVRRRVAAERVAAARERGHGARTERGHGARTQGPREGPCPSVVSSPAAPLRLRCADCGESYPMSAGHCPCLDGRRKRG